MSDNLVQEAIGKGNIDVSMKVRENILLGVFTDVLMCLELLKTCLL